MDHREELEAMPYDDEVAVAEKEAKVKAERYAAATEWRVLPLPAKALLVAAMSLMCFSCYMVQLMTCFVPYELTDRVRDLKGNHWYNLIIWPVGWVALALFFVSSSLFIGYSHMATKLAKSKEPLEVRDDC